jgi:2'-deoxynucleoside 5'-phosphate N-hydrolase
MRVYLAGAMTNPDRDLATLQAILSSIEAAGYDVPTRHIAFPDGRDRDLSITDRELADRDLSWLAESDALIAEVSTPSHGVGIEVANALMRHLPVLLLVRRGLQVSRLLTGLVGLETRPYATVDEACSFATVWLKKSQKSMIQ